MNEYNIANRIGIISGCPGSDQYFGLVTAGNATLYTVPAGFTFNLMYVSYGVYIPVSGTIVSLYIDNGAAAQYHLLWATATDMEKNFQCSQSFETGLEMLAGWRIMLACNGAGNTGRFGAFGYIEYI